MNKIEGKVWLFGNNIDTDLIIAARYLSTSKPEELAKHLMEDADPDFVSKISKGDIIVAGDNFGSGSSREHAPIAIKAAGISAVIAPSFARIFYRNAFNMGLSIYEIDSIDGIDEGDELIIDNKSGEIFNKSKKRSYKFRSIPPFMQELLEAGGLMNYAKAEVNNAI